MKDIPILVTADADTPIPDISLILSEGAGMAAGQRIVIVGVSHVGRTLIHDDYYKLTLPEPLHMPSYPYICNDPEYPSPYNIGPRSQRIGGSKSKRVW